MKEFLRTALKIVLFVVVLWVLWQVALGVFVGEKNYDLHVSLDGKKVEADGTVYYQSGVMARLDWLAEVMGGGAGAGGRQVYSAFRRGRAGAEAAQQRGCFEWRAI